MGRVSEKPREASVRLWDEATPEANTKGSFTHWKGCNGGFLLGVARGGILKVPKQCLQRWRMP
jgi:hypothetical protein